MNEDTTKPIIRNYKDTLFRRLFSDRDNLLSLYNLMSGKNYTNPEALTIVTLDNAIYMNMKNDLAFLIDNTICMYEHQSTLSPNLPLRNLFYVAREYEKLVADATLYSSKRIHIPAPCFVVFYNGIKTDWTKRITKLSDSFFPTQATPNMELIVREFNINLGINDDMFKQCKPLYDYMQYIDKVRNYTLSYPVRKAVEYAINECIKKGILSDFLLQNRTEAIYMSIFEYDEERELKLIRADEREIGHEEGRLEATLSLAIEMIHYDLSQSITDDIIFNKITTIFGIKDEMARQMIHDAKEKR